MKPNLKNVGKRIKKIRKEKNYTMEQFGQLVGETSKGTVNNWEKGNNLPNKKRLEKIALIGNTTVDWIKWGTLEDYISLVTHDQQSYILENFGEQAKVSFRDKLLKQTKIKKISYGQDMNIIYLANTLIEEFTNKHHNFNEFQKNDYEFLFSVFENMTEERFETFIYDLLENKAPSRDLHNEEVIKNITQILYSSYKKALPDITRLREVYLDKYKEN